MAITSVGNADGSQITNFGSMGPSGSVLGAIWYNPATGGMEIQGNNGWEPYTQANGAPSPSYGGGGGGYVAPDPYAKWGGRANYDALRANFNSGLGNIRQSGADAFAGAKLTQQGQAENLFNTVKTKQGQIDRNRQNIELGRMNSIRDIIGYVRSGIQRGASVLANTNSTDSSASEALAKGFNRVGNSKSIAANNQAFLQNREQDNSQDELNLQRSTGINDFRRFKDSEANRIGSEVRQKLQALDDAAVGQSLPDRVAIEQEKQNVVNNGLAQLQEVDNWLMGQLGTINPMDANRIREEAGKLQSAGTATPNPFNVGLPGTQLQIQGPAIDQLPLYTNRRRFE